VLHVSDLWSHCAVRLQELGQTAVRYQRVAFTTPLERPVVELDTSAKPRTLLRSFFIRDGMAFPDLVHALRPNPVNNIQEVGARRCAASAALIHQCSA
jgi:Catalase